MLCECVYVDVDVCDVKFVCVGVCNICECINVCMCVSVWNIGSSMKSAV